MSLSISALATGLSGFANNQLQKKKEEQAQAREDEKLAYARQFAEDDRSYNRGRNAVADQQTAQTFSQQQLANGLNIAAAQRKDQLDQQTMQRKQMFEGMYGDYSTDNIKGLVDKINPLMPSGIDTDQFQRFDVNADGTATLNTYSKADPAKPIGQGKATNKENLMAAARAFFDPQGAYESEITQRAKLAEEQRAASVENAKAERDHSFKIAEIGAQGQNTRANSLFNAGLNIQRDGINWDRKDAYAQQNPGGSGTSSKSPSVPQFSFSQAQPSDLMGFLIGRESGGVHRTASGGLLTSPKGAQGVAQIMPGTGVDPGYGVKPVQNNTEAEHRRFGQDYLSAMYAEFGNDPEKALAAYNAGPKRLQQGLAAAQKSGKPWLAHMPAETQQYVASIKQKYSQQYANGVSQQISSTVAPLTTQILNDFKGVKNELGAEVLNGAQVRGALTNAATLLNKAVAAADPNQKIKFYNDAGTSIALALTGTGLSEQQITDYKNNILTAMVGEGSNFAGVADKVGWRNAPPRQVDPDIEAAINGTESNKPAASTSTKLKSATVQPTATQKLLADAQKAADAEKNRVANNPIVKSLEAKKSVIVKKHQDASAKLKSFDEQTAKLQATYNELDSARSTMPDAVSRLNLPGRKSQIEGRRRERVALERQVNQLSDQISDADRSIQRASNSRGLGGIAARNG